MELDKNKKIILSFLGILAISIIGYYIMQKTSNVEEYVLQTNEQIPIKEQTNTLESEDDEIIILHVAGQVLNEGIVKVKDGARIYEVIEQAGGLLEEADLSNINLAYIVSDGQKIYIPSKQEMQDENYEPIKMPDNDDSTEKLININTAGKEELEKLSGIGSTTANNIIKYRQENGKFEYIEDIMEVSRYRRC